MMGDVDPTLVAMPTVMNPTPKPKKFYFTPAKDLDLLMEVVNVRPYAAEHGFVSEHYEVVTSNLNEH
ncbi:hypothetical protein PR001_g26764 [Phytophthora rubi]|uniref:Uncharacterized protein n=1 Tax=Phytophthora rubi TaxID=129364 RepID=A0A6A3HN56_9STRA|nr:hypothetical protein PR001_g26764 [Phytophthora rubi]